MTTKDDAQNRQPTGRGFYPMSTGFQAFRDEIDRMFQVLSLPEMNWRPDTGGRRDTMGLRVDVSETDGEIQVSAELPGIEEKDVDVSLDEDILRISAEKRSDTERKDKTWHVVERSYGTFARAIRVPSGIDPDSVSATFANGVLTVSLPKPPEIAPEPRKIAIKAA